MSDFNSTSTDRTPANGATRGARAAAKPQLEAAASSAQEAYSHLKEAATETVGQTRETVKAVAGQASEQFHQRYDDLEAYVQLHPARSIGIAAGVGLLLGLLLRGSSKTIYLRDPR